MSIFSLSTSEIGVVQKNAHVFAQKKRSRFISANFTLLSTLLLFDSSGRLPVSVRYQFDGTQYLWHFVRKEKIEPPPTCRLKAMPTSLSDCEVARFSSEVSPSLSKSVAVLDISLLSTVSEAVPSDASSPGGSNL